jgi:hypothetical protein
MRYSALTRELNDSYATLQRIRWRDSLTTLAAESATDGLAVLAPASADQQELAELEGYLTELEAALEPRDPNVVLAIVYQDFMHGIDPAITTDWRSRSETYLTEHDGVKYCIRIELSKLPERAVSGALEWYRSAAERSRNTEILSSALGACRLYARYGAPGAHVQTWLEAGGAELAARGSAPRGDRAFAYCGPDRRCLEGRKYLFGMSTLGYARPIVLDECLAADAEACGAIFLDPSLASRGTAVERRFATRAGALSISDHTTGFAISEAQYLLGDLEEAFGADAFGRFWRSEEPVVEAFESAFGTDPGTWVLSWFESVVGVDPPGPHLARSATFGTFLALSLFAALTAAVNRRRRVA